MTTTVTTGHGGSRLRPARALPRRQAIGRRLRAHRFALGLSTRDIADHIGAGHNQVTHAETSSRDIYTGTLIDIADAVGLDVALVEAHHLPWLDLTAVELAALLQAAARWGRAWEPSAALRSAIAKLTPPSLPTGDTTDAA